MDKSLSEALLEDEMRAYFDIDDPSEENSGADAVALQKGSLQNSRIEVKEEVLKLGESIKGEFDFLGSIYRGPDGEFYCMVEGQVYPAGDFVYQIAKQDQPTKTVDSINIPFDTTAIGQVVAAARQGKSLRRGPKIPYRVLAESAGVSVSQIQRIEAGVQSTGPEVLQRAFDALEISAKIHLEAFKPDHT